MKFHNENWVKTCADFAYIDEPCCPACHEDGLDQYELRVVMIDGEPALLCCAKISFFYPDDQNIGLTPEEKLLRAIFDEKHDWDEEDD